MSDEEVEEFEGTDSGASTTYPSEAGQIRKGGHIVIKDRPCKVIDVSTSKTGKHGHAKNRFVAIDLFTGKKVEDIVPSTHTTRVPFVTRNEYTVLDIDEDGALSLMDDSSEQKDDVNLPPDDKLAEDIKEAFDDGKELIVSVISAMGEEQVISFKEALP